MLSIRKKLHQLNNLWASLVAQIVKHLPSMLETQVQSLGQEEPLEKEMTTDSSTLAWEIPLGYKESDTTERLLYFNDL